MVRRRVRMIAIFAALALVGTATVRVFAAAPAMTRLTWLKMVSSARGWAGTPDGLWRTRDGGAAWTHVARCDSAELGVDAAVFGVDRAWCAIPSGSRVVVERTRDGGRRWESSSVNGVRGGAIGSVRVLGLDMVNADRGWMLITPTGASAFQEPVAVWRTVNGGATWHVTAADVRGHGVGHISQAGDKNGIAFSPTRGGWITGASAAVTPLVDHAGSAGTVWDAQALPAPGSSVPLVGGSVTTYPPVVYRDGTVLIPAVVAGRAGSAQLEFAVSRRSGRWTWGQALTVAAGTRPLWAFGSPRDGAVAIAGWVWLTDDSATRWQRARQRLPGQVEALSMVGANRVWAVCSGRLYATADAGRVWHSVAA